MIIIPARLASTRFPEKVLADIGGLPMVIRTAKRVASIDRVVVACDDEKILDICAAHGVEARLTSTTHKSGTDRINECAQIIDVSDDELIINVQADEPFIETEVLELLIERLNTLKALNAPFIMASCYNAINTESAQDPNLVKVITDADHNAIYFSRSPIPLTEAGKQTISAISVFTDLRKKHSTISAPSVKHRWRTSKNSNSSAPSTTAKKSRWSKWQVRDSGSIRWKIWRERRRFSGYNHPSL
jgi:3-deoxy-manno-octulosonate cytidylyltransferase (CMP-KDO synthetase)